MDITVAICTWNRAKLLDATLEQMPKLRVPPGVQWELLVVNNRCTDNTDEVIEKHARRLPLRRLFEPKQGLSNARNRAVAYARGEMLIWTDDDVLVDEGWLEAYHQARRQYPDAVYFGGTVDPLYEVEPPTWVHQHPNLVEGPFALRQLGPDVRPFEEDEFPFGASLAFRLDRLPGLSFDPNLGRMKDSLISGDETQVLQELKRRGMQGIWVGSARVRHFVPRERLTAKYIWNYWAGLGQTSVRQDGKPAGKSLFKVPRWLIRKYCEYRISSLVRSARKDEQWAFAYRQAAFTLGILRECAR